ncbi:MAG: rod shape-determining protein RodA [Sphingomonadaceae bacterium]
MIDSLLNSRWPQRLGTLPWGILLLVLAIGGFGTLVLYSAAGGSLQPWALNHAVRLLLFTGLAILLSQVPLGAWLRLAYPAYAIVLVGLLLVELLGALGGGAQRWLDLGILRLQPSELMKIALVLALARFYHYLPRGLAGRLAGIWPPVVLILLPVALVLLQPDLGTALMLVAGGVTIMFLGGLPLRWILLPGAAALASLPIVYNLLHEYQQRRVMTFLDPSIDPLGAGYHITQSKIAIGSGGLFGKGFLNGSQSHLQYLPEQHTDFVFATMAEEWGLMGGVALLLAYGVLLNWAMRLARGTQSVFGRLVAGGLSMTIFFYIAVNAMMVMGMAPVVGLPMPLMSYGGSAMMTVMIALGILMAIHRDRAERIL